MSNAEGGSHYKTDTTETIVLMETVTSNVFISEAANVNLSDKRVLREILNKALNSGLAMKHISRLGTKDGNNLNEELLKAENYLHRARTGEWIKK